MTALDLDDYVPQRLLSEPEPAQRHRSRLASVSWLVRNGLPSSRDEPYHYTQVSRILGALRQDPRSGLRAGSEQPSPTDPDEPEHIATPTPDPTTGLLLVLVDGLLDRAYSELKMPAGVIVTGADHLDPRGATTDDIRPDGLVALNRAMSPSGVVIDVAAGTVLDQPIHLLHRRGPGSAAGPHSPFVGLRIGEGARVTVIETFTGSTGTGDESARATNALTEIEIGTDAALVHQQIQQQPSAAVHLANVRYRLKARGDLQATSISLGGAISRVAMDVTLDGDGATAHLAGLYLPSDHQHHEYVVTMDHRADHTTSSQTFRGVIDDHGRGSFTGHVIVAPDTVNTSATQTNKTLLLTPTARSDARPWLEILSDDVACTHGATVGRLDPEQLFYLRSRGISEDQARHLLIDAFARQITDLVTPQWLREDLAALIQQHRAPEGPAT